MRRSGERAGVRAVAIAGAVAVGLSGCQAQSSIVPAHDPDPPVVIETASFGEAEVVGHIYGNALLRSGSRVTTRSQAGSGGPRGTTCSGMTQGPSCRPGGPAQAGGHAGRVIPVIGQLQEP